MPKFPGFLGNEEGVDRNKFSGFIPDIMRDEGRGGQGVLSPDDREFLDAQPKSQTKDELRLRGENLLRSFQQKYGLGELDFLDALNEDGSFNRNKIDTDLLKRPGFIADLEEIEREMVAIFANRNRI